MRRLPILLLALATPAIADAPMTPSAFEAYATGKTLTYALDGQVYGVEQYLPGRRVIWAFKGDECHKGVWYEKAGQVCFLYENEADPQCWSFVQGAGGLRARFAGDPEGSELALVEENENALVCPGPDVGV
jgi:hypothetical protein